MTGRRHLRLVAFGDDVDPPPPPTPEEIEREERLYAETLAVFERRGWHPAVTAIEAAMARRRSTVADQRARWQAHRWPPP